MAAPTTGSTAPPVTDPWRPIVDSLVRELAARLAGTGQPLDPGVVEAQLDLSGGPDSDIALPLHRPAQRLGLKAPTFAARLAAEMGPIVGIREAFASGPYLNFRADRAYLTQNTLELIRRLGSQYGHATVPKAAVCVEHTSANPSGPFHIGRIRNAIIGDTLARALKAAGFPVTTHYYVDDLGRQAAMITWIWSQPIDSWPAPVRATLEGADPSEKADRYLGRPYPALNEYLKDHPEVDAKVQELARALESGRANPEHRATITRVLDGMLASLRVLGITFDRFVWESDLLSDGSVQQVVEELKRATHAVRESNGAWAIDASGYGLPQESTKIIVLRGDGRTLYVTRDVAYHRKKFAEFGRVIDVLGANHQLHGKVLEILLKEVGETRVPELVLYQYITAADGGGMSTRKGTAVYLDDLMDEAILRAREEILKRRTDLSAAEVDSIAGSVASGAIRFHIVRVAAEKTVAFRWEDALSFEGRSGPFLQYSYARASSILRKAAEGATDFAFEAAMLTAKEEWALVRQLSRLPATVAYSARTAHVHTLAGFAHAAAEEFNRFYQEVPVLKAGAERESRLALVSAFRQTLGNCLDLLGIDRLDRM